jgi:hypothetical protein
MNRLLDASRTLYHRLPEQLRHPLVRLSGRLTQSPRQTVLLSALRRDGFAVIEDFFSRGECNALVQQIERVFAIAPDRLWHSNDGADTRAFAAETLSTPIQRFNLDPMLLSLGESYSAHPLVPFFTLAGRLRPTPGNLGSGGGWHRDTAVENQFKTLVYLTDTGLENGPFEYVPGSHRVRALVKTILGAGIAHAQNRLTDEEVERACAAMSIRPKTLTAPAGTLLLIDSSGLHRGMPISTGERYALTTYYFAPWQIESMWQTGKFTKYFVGEKSRSAA